MGDPLVRGMGVTKIQQETQFSKKFFQNFIEGIDPPFHDILTGGGGGDT